MEGSTEVPSTTSTHLLDKRREKKGAMHKRVHFHSEIDASDGRGTQVMTEYFAEAQNEIAMHR